MRSPSQCNQGFRRLNPWLRSLTPPAKANVVLHARCCHDLDSLACAHGFKSDAISFNVMRCVTSLSIGRIPDSSSRTTLGNSVRWMKESENSDLIACHEILLDVCPRNAGSSRIAHSSARAHYLERVGQQCSRCIDNDVCTDSVGSRVTWAASEPEESKVSVAPNSIAA